MVVGIPRRLGHYLVFVLLFVIGAIAYYDSVLDKGPLNTHLWRQTDCLSMTQHFADGNSLWEPEMHIQLGDNGTSGKSAGEFPILYYTIGQLWKLFGQSHLAYRLFYLLILFAGLLALYKSLCWLLGDVFWSLGITLLLYTSPVYVVYGISFLTDVPAFSFVLIALYFFTHYYRLGKSRWLFVSLAFFALAGLIKVSSMIAFLFLFFILFLETLSVNTLGDKKLFHHRGMAWLGFLSVLAAIFGWYYYAHVYNSLHTFKYTFNNVHPLWLLNEGDFQPLLREIAGFSSLVFFSRPMLLVLALAGVFNLFQWKKIPLLAWLTNAVIIMGAAAYFVLWAPLMGVHDYYYVALLILFPAIVLPFLYRVRMMVPRLYKKMGLRILLGLFLVYNFAYGYSVVRLKTLEKKGEFPLVGNTEFVSYMRWANWHTGFHWGRYRDMRPYLLELGIGEQDLVITFPDHSFNTSLYLMDRKGWTNFKQYQSPEEINALIDLGARYLFVSEPEWLEKPFLQSFLKDEIGNFKGIGIYRLKQD